MSHVPSSEFTAGCHTSRNTNTIVLTTRASRDATRLRAAARLRPATIWFHTKLNCRNSAHSSAFLTGCSFRLTAAPRAPHQRHTRLARRVDFEVSAQSIVWYRHCVLHKTQTQKALTNKGKHRGVRESGAPRDNSTQVTGHRETPTCMVHRHTPTVSSHPQSWISGRTAHPPASHSTTVVTLTPYWCSLSEKMLVHYCPLHTTPHAELLCQVRSFLLGGSRKLH